MCTDVFDPSCVWIVKFMCLSKLTVGKRYRYWSLRICNDRYVSVLIVTYRYLSLRICNYRYVSVFIVTYRFLSLRIGINRYVSVIVFCFSSTNTGHVSINHMTVARYELYTNVLLTVVGRFKPHGHVIYSCGSETLCTNGYLIQICIRVIEGG